MIMMPRSSAQDILRIMKNNKIITIPKRKFLKKYGLANVIRLRPEEYAAIDRKATYLTLFNLQYTGHQIGKIYALALVVTPGHYHQSKEVLPVLSFKNCLIAECLAVKNGVSYSKLSAEDFTHSLATIKNISQLKTVILQKYSQSMPELSAKEIVLMGVAITKLKIISRGEEYKKRPEGFSFSP